MVPCAIDAWQARAITGPSATGSEKGICSSISSTPAAAICFTTCRFTANEG